MRLRTEGLTWREIDGETVVLDLQASTYLSTNGTGSFLLQQLAEERTRDELVDALVAEYEVDRPRAEADTDAFVATLREKGLLEGAS
ncbi:PqqD family protein [Angustibacter sp. Root456]|uniref:PqqD family protein n=1 Tax=Angustibacter sp. Root456 TaxID=1736539 RepID=UPI0007011B2E|nr:PqqD family protein [Angustibacter sp. Root456]KQX62912.1 hypothetical protein ASD06_12925 [Angustibacter sp. Root456]